MQGVETAWLTADPRIRDDLRSRGYRSYTWWSRDGIAWLVRSGVVIYDSLPKDVNFWLTRNARLVLLRHGIGIKKIERAIDVPEHRLYKLFHGRWWQRFAYSAALPWHRNIPDLVFSTSDEHAEQAVRYFGVDRSQVRVTGSPRLDRLYQGPGDDGTRPLQTDQLGATPSALGELERLRDSDRRLVLFMPTFREGNGPQRFPWEDLARAADASDVEIIVKLHPVDAARGVADRDTVENLSGIRFIDPKIDPVLIYRYMDALITDFSSAAFDYLLLDRPIIYYVPDLQQFMQSRPLIDDLDRVTAGPICEDVDQLIVALQRMDEDMAAFEPQRRDLADRFHLYRDSASAERVLKELLQAVDNGWR